MQNISILVVEDELIQREALVEYLSIFFDTVYQASNGVEALEVYNKELPNVIFTDINMPKSSGIEFIQKVRKVDKNVHIIIFSASTETDDFLQVVSLNLIDYLVKPLQIDKMKAVIAKVISKVSSEKKIALSYGYLWDSQTKTLYLHKQIIELSSYETAFLDSLILSINSDVSYEDIHLHINEDSNYSQDAIFALAKRIRKKTTKGLIKSSFKFGYRIESL